MKNIITILILVIFSNCIIAQDLPKISKQQMFDDFDTLTNVLIKINPCNYVRKTVNNYSMNDSILSLRKNIDTISSTESFFWLVNKALIYCQEGHTSVANRNFFYDLDSICAKRYNATKTDISTLKLYDKLYYSKLKSYKLTLPIKYIDGEYRVLCDFKYKNNIITQNSIITTCNNQNIHKYINTLQGSAEMMHWDFENKRFYIDNFIQYTHLQSTEKIRLTFSNEGKILEQSFMLNDTIVTSQKLKYQQERIPKVQYFENGQILYVRIPIMDNGEFYLQKIDSVFKNNNVKKVVVDIRDNLGGGDGTWYNILALLIDKPIMISTLSCVNIKNYRMDKLDKNLKPIVYKSNFMKEDLYLLTDKNEIGRAHV